MNELIKISSLRLNVSTLVEYISYILIYTNISLTHTYNITDVLDVETILVALLLLLDFISINIRQCGDL